MLTPPCEWPPFQTMLPDTSGFSNACAGAEQGMRMLDNPANMTQVIIMRVFIFPPPFSIEPAKQSSARPQPSLPSFIRPVRHEYSRRFNAVCIVWTFAENGESIAPLCGHSKHLDEGVGNFARER